MMTVTVTVMVTVTRGNHDDGAGNSVPPFVFLIGFWYIEKRDLIFC